MYEQDEENNLDDEFKHYLYDDEFTDELYDDKNSYEFDAKKNQETNQTTSLSTKKYRKRDRVRRIDQDFLMMGYGTIKNMSQKIKIPRVRNTYLREAFFKCYFQGPYYKASNYEGAFNIFVNLFFYREEIREATRNIFDTFTKDKIIKTGANPVEYSDEYFTFLHYLKTLVFDGFKTLDSLPSPKTELPPNHIKKDLEKLKEFISKKETVEITFNPKKSDFPNTDDLFINLSGCSELDIIHRDEKTYLRLFERNYDHLNFARISNQLWLQTFAYAVFDAVKEIEKEIIDTDVLHAKINVANIKQAISHFEQYYPDAKLMSRYQKAYFISLRYRKRSTENKPLYRESILKALTRAEK